MFGFGKKNAGFDENFDILLILFNSFLEILNKKFDIGAQKKGEEALRLCNRIY